MIRVGVIGSGYAGAEIVRYLLGHPHVAITYLASSSLAGRSLADAYPCFLGQDLPVCEAYAIDRASDAADFFFQSNKDMTGMRIAQELLSRGKRIVDIPADFRLKDPDTYKQYYGAEHQARELLPEAVYGISELHAEEISKARLVANPGCYATGAILALAPLVSGGLVDTESIIVDSKSGVSGAGRSQVNVANLFCEVNEGFKAYKVGNHGHTPEIEQELTQLAGQRVVISFTPHLAPMNRGILTTCYAKMPLPRLPKANELTEKYREFYSGCPFVVVREPADQPSTKDVVGSNYCHIAVMPDERTGRVVVTSAIDNMGKGAAGQAVQNMNLMCGLDQATGLTSVPLYP